MPRLTIKSYIGYVIPYHLNLVMNHKLSLIRWNFEIKNLIKYIGEEHDRSWKEHDRFGRSMIDHEISTLGTLLRIGPWSIMVKAWSIMGHTKTKVD